MLTKVAKLASWTSTERRETASVLNEGDFIRISSRAFDEKPNFVHATSPSHLLTVSIASMDLRQMLQADILDLDRQPGSSPDALANGL